jgi:hypothetical protein
MAGRARAAQLFQASSRLAAAGETLRKPQLTEPGRRQLSMPRLQGWTLARMCNLGSLAGRADCAPGVFTQSNAVFCRKHLEFVLSKDISFS